MAARVAPLLGPRLPLQLRFLALADEAASVRAIRLVPVLARLPPRMVLLPVLLLVLPLVLLLVICLACTV